jgi:O-antigen/teichoic acid export membrane protein
MASDGRLQRPTLLSNVAAQLLAQAGVVVAQLIYVVVAARLLDVRSFGLFSFAVGVTQMVLIVSDLGLNLVIVRQLASESSGSREFLGQILALKALLALALWGGLALWGKLWSDPETALMLTLFGGGMAIHSVAMSFNMAFQAHGQLHISGAATFLLALLQLIIGAIFLLAGAKVFLLGLAYAAAAAITLAINVLIFRRKFHEIALSFRFREGFRLLKQSLPLGLGAMFGAIANRVDVPLLFYIAGATEVGIYAGAYRISGALYNAPVALFAAVLPFFSRLSWNTPDMDDMLERSLFTAIIGASVLCLFFYTAGPQVVVLLFGEAYRPSGAILRILSCALIPAFINVGFLHASVSQQSTASIYTVAVGVGAIANVLLNLWWMPLWKSHGAAYATVGTELLILSTYFLLLGGRVPIRKLARPLKTLGISLGALLIISIAPIEGVLGAVAVVLAYLVVVFWMGEFSLQDWSFWTQRLAPRTTQ